MGLAGADKQNNVEVHSIDDTRQDNDQALIRTSGPRQKASVSAQGPSNAVSKEEDKKLVSVRASSNPESTGKSKVKSSSESKKEKTTWSQAIIPLPASVKVGPPARGKKQDSSVAPSNGRSQPVLDKSQKKDVTRGDANTSGASSLTKAPCISRGPTPPTSRPASPMPPDSPLNAQNPILPPEAPHVSQNDTQQKEASECSLRTTSPNLAPANASPERRASSAGMSVNASPPARASSTPPPPALAPVSAAPMAHTSRMEVDEQLPASPDAHNNKDGAHSTSKTASIVDAGLFSAGPLDGPAPASAATIPSTSDMAIDEPGAAPPSSFAASSVTTHSVAQSGPNANVAAVDGQLPILTVAQSVPHTGSVSGGDPERQDAGTLAAPATPGIFSTSSAPPVPRSAPPAPRPAPPGSVSVPSMLGLQQIAEGQTKARKRSGTSSNAKSDQKKRKTAADSDKPDWVAKVTSLFESTNLGPEWAALLSGWFKFEEQAGFQDSGKLGTRRRPRAVSDWIQRARTPTFRPEITDVDEFAADFTAWWQSLQPEWRCSGNGEAARDDGDWKDIRRSGVNGLVSVVAALFFWGNAIQPAGDRVDWLEALGDVTYVFEHLV